MPQRTFSAPRLDADGVDRTLLPTALRGWASWCDVHQNFTLRDLILEAADRLDTLERERRQ